MNFSDNHLHWNAPVCILHVDLYLYLACTTAAIIHWDTLCFATNKISDFSLRLKNWSINAKYKVVLTFERLDLSFVSDYS